MHWLSALEPSQQEFEAVRDRLTLSSFVSVCVYTAESARLPSHCLVFHGQPSLCILTSCTLCFSTKAFATTIDQPSSSIQRRTKANVPASLDIPSLPARTHEVLHIPHTSLSFPSFTHPHLAAATASIAGGLFAYVVSLYVARRRRNELVDDGRYSDVKSSDLAIVADGIDDLNGFA